MAKKFAVGIIAGAGLILLALLFREEKLPAPQAPERPQRLVALTLATAEMLFDLVPRQRIVGVHKLAADRTYSNIRDRVDGISLLGANTEKIIALKPDMVFVASYTGIEFLNQLRAASLPVFKFSAYKNVEDIFRNIETMGRLVGEPERARQIVQGAREEIRMIQSRIPKGKTSPRLLALMRGGWVAGSRTSQHSLIRLAGARNVAAEHGIKESTRISAEQLIAWNPDTILVGKDPGNRKSVKAVIFSNRIYRSLRKKKIIEIPYSHLTNVSQHIVKGLRNLVEELYR